MGPGPCRALLFHGSSWLFAHSLFSLCFFSRRTTSAHGVNLGSLKSFLKSQGNVLLTQAFAGVIPTCFVLFLFLGKRQCHLLPFFFFPLASLWPVTTGVQQVICIGRSAGAECQCWQRLGVNVVI